MEQITDTNRNMASANYPTCNCDATNITAQEAHRYLQRCRPIIKQEEAQGLDVEKTPQCIDEKGTHSNDYRCPYEALQSSDSVNYYDSEFNVSVEVKREAPDDECPQSVDSMSSGLDFEKVESSNIMVTRDVEKENQKDGFSSNRRQEGNSEENRIVVKTQTPEERRILENARNTSNQCDVPVTPQEVQCKLCGKRFKNSYDLSEHDNEHIKAVPPIPVDNEVNDPHKYYCCKEYFDNNDNLLAHVRIVHNNKKPKYNIYPIGKDGEEMKYRCESCERVYKNKPSLVSHLKRIHYDYGKKFKCWCGEEFRSPVHLSEHKYNFHSTNIKNKNNNKFQCDFCKKIIRTKACLILHLRSIHYDYGKKFECWCGKKFSTPIYLYKHKNRQHGFKAKNANNSALKFQCDSCRKVFKSKNYIIKHIKSMHFDYSRIFNCWCGKQFRTPIHLYLHKNKQHGASKNNIAVKKNSNMKVAKRFPKEKAV